jgi:signal recognition particle receptor subunit beta
MKMNDIKVAIIGNEEDAKARLIKNLTKNSTTVKFHGMDAGIDIGYTIANGRRVYLFGASSEERKRFFEEVVPAGIDLGIVLVNSSEGISTKDKEIIEEVKEKNMPCMVFFNDTKESEFHNFGKSIVHGSAKNGAFANRLLEHITKIS